MRFYKRLKLFLYSCYKNTCTIFEDSKRISGPNDIHHTHKKGDTQYFSIIEGKNVTVSKQM